MQVYTIHAQTNHAKSTEITDWARPTRIKQDHGRRVAEGGLFAVLANKLIRLVLVPDATMTNAIMSAIRAINKDSNPGEHVAQRLHGPAFAN